MLTAIRAATAAMTFQTCIYGSGSIGREFVDALVERARAGVNVHALVERAWAGVKVQVLLDGVGSIKMQGSLLQAMEQGDRSGQRRLRARCADDRAHLDRCRAARRHGAGVDAGWPHRWRDRAQGFARQLGAEARSRHSARRIPADPVPRQGPGGGRHVYVGGLDPLRQPVVWPQRRGQAERAERRVRPRAAAGVRGRPGQLEEDHAAAVAAATAVAAAGGAAGGAARQVVAHPASKPATLPARQLNRRRRARPPARRRPPATSDRSSCAAASAR